MLCYPQLTSGAISQFPVTRTASIRTVANQLIGGSTIRMADSGARSVFWQLRYSNLTDVERSSIEALFEAAEGQLTTFTFLDPTDNLLGWSEDFTQPVWRADPLLVLSGGISDPLGGFSATRITNTAQTLQRIIQQAGAPSGLLYCCSVYLKSGVPTPVQLVAGANSQVFAVSATPGTTWSRKTTAVRVADSSDTVYFGVEVPAGVQLDMFGFQVEAQPETGLYKKTFDKGGVYSRTRFSSDTLVFASDAPNQNSATVELISHLS